MWRFSRRKISQALSICFVLLLSYSAQGETRYDLHDDPIAHGARTAIGFITDITAESIADRSIQIDDTWNNVNDDAILRNQSGRLISLSSFKTGMKVGYYFLGDNIITKMWQIQLTASEKEEQQVPSEVNPDSESAPAGSGDIKLEDGVWTN